jgi:hypothetical protein
LQFESLIPPSSRAPLLLTSSPFNNPIDLLCRFFSVRRLEPSVVSVSLGNRSASRILDISQGCSTEGKWLVLRYSIPSLESARFLK